MNKKILICLFVVVCLASCAVYSKKVRWPRILLLGDSLTELSFSVNGGWGSKIASSVTKKMDVINRGYGGYTTKSYNDVFDEALIGQVNESTAVVVLLLGTNDANSNSVPVSEYLINLQMLLHRLKFHKGISLDKVILVTPPPTFIGIDTKPYADTVQQVAQKFGVTTVDMHTAFKEDSRGKALVVDGVHFSPVGAQLFFDKLWPSVNEKVENYYRANN